MPTGWPASRVVMINGQLDISGPLDVPWKLAKVMPDAELVVIGDEGHGGDDSTFDAIVADDGPLRPLTPASNAVGAQSVMNGSSISPVHVPSTGCVGSSRKAVMTSTEHGDFPSTE